MYLCVNITEFPFIWMLHEGLFFYFKKILNHRDLNVLFKFLNYIYFDLYFEFAMFCNLYCKPTTAWSSADLTDGMHTIQTDSEHMLISLADAYNHEVVGSFYVHSTICRCQ